jgi:hypothetical protein
MAIASVRELRKAARLFAGNWRKQENFVWSGRHDFDFPELYGHYTLSNRDSGLLEQSNHDAIVRTMRESHAFREDETWRVELFNHWAVGYVHALVVQSIDENGEVTNEFETLHDMIMQLQEYPVLNEDDYMQREFLATCANIRDSLRMSLWFDVVPEGEGLVPDLYQWFAEHDQSAIESRDDHGGYPSDEQLENALTALGYIESE